MGLVVEAEDDEDVMFDGKEKEALLLEADKILLTKNLYRKYTSGNLDERQEALQTIIHEMAEAMLQVIKDERPTRYGTIKKIAFEELAELYSKTPKADRTYTGEVLANHIWAVVLEHKLAGIQPEDVESSHLRDFLRRGCDIIEKNGLLFGNEFNYIHAAKNKVIEGLRSGVKIHRAASEVEEPPAEPVIGLPATGPSAAEQKEKGLHQRDYTLAKRSHSLLTSEDLSQMDKTQLDRLVDELKPEELKDIFLSVDELIDKQGIESVRVSLRYLFVKLIVRGGLSFVEQSKNLGRLPKQDIDCLKEVFANQGRRPPTFADIARFVIAASIDRPGFKGFHGFERLNGFSRVLMVGSYKKAGLSMGQFLTPPTGLHRMACFLRVFGVEVDVVDPDLDGEKALVQLATDHHYDIVMFTLLQPTMANGIGLMQILREHKGTRDALFMGGGQGASFNYQMLLEKAPVQIIGAGLGEFLALDITVQYAPGRKTDDFSNIEGLYMKSGDGKILFTGHINPYRPLDLRVISHTIDFQAIPYLRYWAYNSNQYDDVDLESIKSKSMGLKTIRFYTELYCPYNCSFCVGTKFFSTVVVGKQPVASLSPEDVIRIIENAISVYPELETIYFNSDNLILDRRRVYRICQLIEDRLSGRDLKFFGLARVDEVDPIILHRMYEVGFRMLTFGVEHTAQPVLADIGKGLRLLDDKTHAERAIRLAESANYTIPDTLREKLQAYLASSKIEETSVEPGHVIKRAIRESVEAGLTFQASMILFYPTASIDDIKKAIEDILELIEIGAVVDIFRYVESYSGTEIAARSYPTVAIKTNVGNISIEIPGYILPLDPRVKEIASLASDDSNMEAVEKAIRTNYKYTGKWTRTLDTLALLWGVYHYLDLPKDSVERTIEHVMSQLGFEAGSPNITNVGPKSETDRTISPVPAKSATDRASLSESNPPRREGPGAHSSGRPMDDETEPAQTDEYELKTTVSLTAQINERETTFSEQTNAYPRIFDGSRFNEPRGSLKTLVNEFCEEYELRELPANIIPVVLVTIPAKERESMEELKKHFGNRAVVINIHDILYTDTCRYFEGFFDNPEHNDGQIFDNSYPDINNLRQHLDKA